MRRVLLYERPDILKRNYESREQYEQTLQILFERELKGMKKGRNEKKLERQKFRV
jgi:hypothetical protein